ncbi:restriction endonuclease subunit S [Sorangium sp. KYC3313]|uniref:restriction endonuclease subunit S n=1 Tax=Sorangium sp. KYC3313 TaxID=3449740 RepID=UPI003F8988F6
MSELPVGWAWATLQTLAEIKGGVTKGQKRRQEERLQFVPYLRVANVQRGYIDLSEVAQIEATDREIAELRLQAGDVLFNEGGDRDKLGRGWVWEEQLPLCIHQNHVFRARILGDVVLPRFLSMYSNTFGQEYFVGEGKQTTNLASLSLTKLSALPVPIPPRFEQRRIVAKLEALTAKSRRAKEALDAIPALLERFRQSVLAAAFRGDLTADWREKNPDVEPAEELLRRIRAERRRRWEEAELAKMRAKGKVPGDDRWKEKYEEPTPVDASELPELPEGWCWASIGELAEVGTGTTPSRSVPSYYGGGIPWVTSGALNEWLVGSTDETVTETALRETSLTLYPPNTLLVAMYGEGKTRGKVSELTIEAATNQAIAAIVMRDSAGSAKSYVKLALLKSYEDIRLISSGGVQPNLNLDKVRAIKVPLAPLREMQEIVKQVQSCIARYEAIKRHAVDVSSDLALLDRAILAKAFRGELVPQDPNDEPASVLLERLRAEREQNGKTPNGAGRRRAAASPPPAPSDPTVPRTKSPASRRSQAPARSRG